MAEKPLSLAFSVIIPTRNREHYLREAVESVLTQRDVELELIIVNDGDPLQQQFTDRRVRVLDNGKRTAVPARNLGASSAKGDFIAFLDDDDFWIDPTHLAKSQSALRQHTDFYFANGEMRFPNGSTKLFDRDATADTLKFDNTILISAVCYRRNLHTTLGMFDESIPYYWDWDWYLRVAAAGFKLRHQTKPAVAIRVHPGNMSGQNDGARRANLDALIVKHHLGPIPLKNHTDFV